MSRCQEFPPLGFRWNGVSGTDLIELLKVRREKAESEKEEKRKAKRMQRKSSKKREHKQDMHKEDKKRKIQDKNECENQDTRKNKVQDLQNCLPVKGLELEQAELQLKELLEKWVPPPILSQQSEFDDLNWLFDTTRPKTGISITSNFPFSPLAGARALPYTLLY